MKIKVVRKGIKAATPSFEYRPGYFFTDDPMRSDYDWLVVFDEMPREDRGTFRGGFEPLCCPREQTILCTWEPVSIKSYSRTYTRQFGHLLSNRPQSADGHPHYHLGRGYYPWFVDRTYAEVVSTPIPAKSQLLSAVCSAKQMKGTKHWARYRLVKRLSEEISEFAWFGHDIRELGRKYEALDGYRYHIAVENHIAPDYWSEKIADAWLCECLPFYAGDPNLGKVFPPESFIPIPIDDPDEAVRIVRRAIAADEFEKRRPAILEAKRLLLEHYNFWAQVIAVIENSADQAVTPVNPLCPVRLYARKALRRHSPVAALEDGWNHLKRLVRYGR